MHDTIHAQPMNYKQSIALLGDLLLSE